MKKEQLIEQIIEQIIEPFTCRILSIQESERLKNDLGVIMQDYEIQEKEN